MKRIAAISLLVTFLGFGCLYLGDYALLRVRIARNSGYGSVAVSQYYAIQEKNSRVEYVYGSTQDQACVNSLFRHHGLPPCWYLRRHPEQQIKI